MVQPGITAIGPLRLIWLDRRLSVKLLMLSLGKYFWWSIRNVKTELLDLSWIPEMMGTIPFLEQVDELVELKYCPKIKLIMWCAFHLFICSFVWTIFYLDFFVGLVSNFQWRCYLYLIIPSFFFFPFLNVQINWARKVYLLLSMTPLTRETLVW